MYAYLRLSHIDGKNTDKSGSKIMYAGYAIETRETALNRKMNRDLDTITGLYGIRRRERC